MVRRLTAEPVEFGLEGQGRVDAGLACCAGVGQLTSMTRAHDGAGGLGVAGERRRASTIRAGGGVAAATAAPDLGHRLERRLSLRWAK